MPTVTILIERGMEPQAYFAYGPGVPGAQADGHNPQEAFERLCALARDAGCQARFIPVEVEEVSQQELRDTVSMLVEEYLGLPFDQQDARGWDYVDSLSGSWLLRRVPQTVIEALARMLEETFCYPAAVRLEEIYCCANERDREAIASRFLEWRRSDDVALHTLARSLLFEHIQK